MVGMMLVSECLVGGRPVMGEMAVIVTWEQWIVR